MTAVVQMYAIRHKPSGGYLPRPNGHAGRGGSHVEPRVFKDGSGHIPRMFPTMAGAKAALGQWLRGKHKGIREYEDGYYYTVGADIVPCPDRKREDMEIVTVEVTLP